MLLLNIPSSSASNARSGMAPIILQLQLNTLSSRVVLLRSFRGVLLVIPLRLHGIIVVALLELRHGVREGRKPTEGEPSEHRLDAFPPRLFAPALLLLLQLLDSGLVVPNRVDLSAQHDHREDGEQETLEDEEEEQDHGRWRGVRGTCAPLARDAEGKLIYGQENRVNGYQGDVELKENKTE